MLPPFDYFTYRQARQQKQAERAARFSGLPLTYYKPFDTGDKFLIDQPIEKLVHDVQSSLTNPLDILLAYGKVAIRAQERTNCITELLIPEAEKWLKSEVNLKGPLAGIPVSVKDTVNVKGFDSTLGYSTLANKPHAEDGPMIQLLKDAGAVPYAKTALPTTLLSFESASGLWGPCLNPHVPGYSPGGSTGGEGALLAQGGRIGIGSDVAGSVRVPAAWSGIYSLRCSTSRWPKAGVSTSMPGQEGIPSVFSPMARTLNDLTYFTKAIIGMQPWKYDNTVHPISWRAELETEAQSKPLRIGLLANDGIVPPTPAIERALSTTVSALTEAGHTVTPIHPPTDAGYLTGLNLASLLLNTDGCHHINVPLHSFEPSDPGADQMTRLARLPRPVRWLYYLYVRYIKRDHVLATCIRDFGPKTAAQTWPLVAQREAFRATWHKWWNAEPQQFDFILCPANATPALPHKAMHDAVSSCGYTFFWNLLDYSAGVMPVGHVDATRDSLVGPYRSVLKQLGCDNAISRGAWKHYDATLMQGLPTAVQIVGRRWQEEQVLGYMAVVEKALDDYSDPKTGESCKYTLLDIEY
ncbi:hypothetical protein N7495_007320 [Penicillium taxi]|uniref:uncharacterized protein n=1 Tax=Penicillium taxi TaxID=168475 RepID=UPI00254540D0|nr:uncharacterized protein N7495_007320 [Penicillium taxi]KAJ5895629.1 hypothetical protein N7495_007320 [Penicillium taxi]